VIAGLEHDLRRDAVLVHVGPELRGDPVEPVEVLGARAQVRVEGRPLEAGAVQDLPDVVRGERIGVRPIAEDALQR
jgi:hypothetical protein